jgi:hypothetical protein
LAFEGSTDVEVETEDSDDDRSATEDPFEVVSLADDDDAAEGQCVPWSAGSAAQGGQAGTPADEADAASASSVSNAAWWSIVCRT